METRGPDDQVKLRGMIDKSLEFDLEDSDYHCSQNSTHMNHVLNAVIRKFIYQAYGVTELQSEWNKHANLIQAEMTVFAGNLMRLILGDKQPRFHLCEMADANPETMAEYGLSHPYFAVSEHVNNFQGFEDILENHSEVLNESIRNLSAMLVACYFIGETDWDDSNYGIVEEGALKFAVRLDPGCAFNNLSFEEENISSKTMSNLLLHYIHAVNEKEEHAYLDHFIDEDGHLLHPRAKALFCNMRETIAAVGKIGSLSKEDFNQCIKDSFDPSHYQFAQWLAKNLYKRVVVFQAVSAEMTREYLAQKGKERSGLFSSSQESSGTELNKRSKNEDNSETEFEPRKRK